MASESETEGAIRTAGAIDTPVVRSTIDFATLIGILGATSLIATAIILGGSPGAFLDLPAILIVIGGTLGVTTACFSLKDMGGVVQVLIQTVMHSARNPTAAAVHVLQLAEVARYKGVLDLQRHLPYLESERMLHRGMTMIVDGTPGEAVERIMQHDLQATAARHARSTSVLRRAAEISPAMGLIGTLVGLVQMLGNLEDPSSIGPSMAVALLTTFYGAILANLVFIPLAAKVERNSSDEALISQIYVMASASVGRQENPRRLEMLLNTLLPPGHRIEYFR